MPLTSKITPAKLTSQNPSLSCEAISRKYYFQWYLQELLWGVGVCTVIITILSTSTVYCVHGCVTC